jgi:hypothetical protein
MEPKEAEKEERRGVLSQTKEIAAVNFKEEGEVKV